MKAKNKIITSILLSAGAAAGTALINKYIKMAATSKKLLTEAEGNCYKWRLGNIYYTKVGSGKPLLLIHDLHHASSGCEWNSLIPLLKDYYTVYTIDLLGCGRSEKPNLTYTNFLYVQLLNDFIKSEIGRRTNVIASGASAAIAAMTCSYNPDLMDQIMLINPESFSECSKIPGKTAKFYKWVLDTPILGTLLYHIASSKTSIEQEMKERDFHNPYHVSPVYVNQYYEAAHLGESPKAIYASVLCNYTKCSITHVLGKINNSIYILGGSGETQIRETILEYTRCNPAIEYSLIPNTRHLPQLEDPREVSNTIQMYFN